MNPAVHQNETLHRTDDVWGGDRGIRSSATSFPCAVWEEVFDARSGDLLGCGRPDGRSRSVFGRLVVACGVVATSATGSVAIERDPGAASPSSAPASSTAAPVERGIVFGGYGDVIGGMTVDDVRGRGWTLEKTSEGDGCVDSTFRRGTETIQVGSKNRSNVVSTVSVPTGNGRLTAETARIHTPSATYAQIASAYPDASLSYTPPINRGPSGTIGKLLVTSNSQPDRAILFTAVTNAPSSTPPPADTVFAGAEGGTLSALTGGSFGCA